MTILRKDLVNKLDLVSPAIADTNIIPVMTHFWFTGKSLMAYNDQIALSCPLETDFKGAVPGILLSLLKSSTATNVELEAGGDHLLVMAALSKFKLAMINEDAFLEMFQIEDPAPDEFIACDMDELVDGIDACLKSVGSDTSVPDQLGVAIIAEEGRLLLFATNDATISHATIKIKKKAPFKRVILPTLFCKELLSLAKTKCRIAIAEDHALLVVDGGIYLFGRLIETDSPINYVNVLKQHIPDSALKNMVKMPERLLGALERAMVITDAEQVASQVVIKAANKTDADYKIMRFTSKSVRGEVTDQVRVGLDQPDITVALEPRLLKAGVKYDKFLVTERCAIMAKGSLLYMIACHTGK